MAFKGTIKDCVNLYKQTDEYKAIQRELNKNKVKVTIDKNGMQSDNKETQNKIDEYMEEAADKFLKEYGIEVE